MALPNATSRSAPSDEIWVKISLWYSLKILNLNFHSAPLVPLDHHSKGAMPPGLYATTPLSLGGLLSFAFWIQGSILCISMLWIVFSTTTVIQELYTKMCQYWHKIFESRTIIHSLFIHQSILNAILQFILYNNQITWYDTMLRNHT